MVFYSHDTALEFWRSRAPYEAAHELPRCAEMPSTSSIAPMLQIIDSCPVSIPEGQSIHVIGSPSSARHKHELVSFHYSYAKEPMGGYVVVGSDAAVAAPELAFVQCAASLPFTSVVELGYCLTASFTYVRDCIDIQGFCSCEPLTTPKRMLAFLNKAQEMRGAHACQKALRYIAPGAASPREVALAMMLTMSTREGGYGFPLAELNGKIELPLEDKRIIGRNFLKVDMLWRQSKVAIEYDSDQWHAGEERIAYDSRRRNLLKSLGFEVITVTNREIKNAHDVDRIAQVLASAMKRRLRIRAASFMAKRDSLRRQLLQSRRF